MRNNNDLGVSLVDNERLARLESEVEHTQQDIHEVRTDIRDIKDSSKNVEIAIVELAEIARTNQRVFPRLEAVEVQLKSTNHKLATWGGGVAVIIFLLTFFGSEIRTAILHNTTVPISHGSPVNQHEAKKGTPQEKVHP